MPCQGPSDAECRSADHYAQVAENLIYFFNKLKLWNTVPEGFKDGVTAVAASDGWTHQGPTLDEITAALCTAIQAVSPSEAHDVIYDGKSREARRLADWWEDHQELDAAREAEEEHEKERQRVIESLTPYQRAVLRLED